jgi:hypothetical protein
VHRIVTSWALVAALAGCKDKAPAAPSAGEIADRGWRAHEHVVIAGERAATCAEAGAAMQRVFAIHRQAFVDAIAIDRDRDQLIEATEFIEAHQERYADLETRMIGLAERCPDDPGVQAAFTMMEAP